MPGASLLNSTEQARRDGFHGPVRQPREQGEKAIMGLLRRQRSEILLCGLVAQIVISPLADSHRAVGALLAVITLLLLLTGATYIANRQIVPPKYSDRPAIIEVDRLPFALRFCRGTAAHSARRTHFDVQDLGPPAAS